MDFDDHYNDLMNLCMEVVGHHSQMHLDVKKKAIKLSSQYKANKSVNVSGIFNYAFFECLIPYLTPHDLLLLLSTCKYMKIFLGNKEFSTNFSQEEFIADIVEHNCKRCKRFIKISEGLLESLFLVTCKKLDITKITKEFKFEYSSNMDKTTKDKYVNKCALYASKRNEKDQINLFRFIVSKWVIVTDIKLFEFICSKDDINIIKDITQYPYSFTNEQIKVLLPYVCKHKIMNGWLYSFSSLFNNFEANNDNYVYLLNLINDNQNIYSDKINYELFYHLVKKQQINQSDSFLIAKLGCKFYDKEIVEILLKTIENDEAKILLVEKAYQFELSKSLEFLNTKEEWNLLSLKYASKFNSEIVYIDKISTEQYLRSIFNLSENENNTIYGLILKSDRYSDLLQFGEMFEKVFTLVLKTLKLSRLGILGYHSDIICSLNEIPQLDIKYKLQLVPLAYKHWCSNKLSFLGTTKEFNRLSIKAACENMQSHHFDVKIYTDKLSTKEYLQEILKYDNIKVKSKLINGLKNRKVSDSNLLIKEIIAWVINYEEYKKDMIESLILIKDLKLEFKTLLVPLAYKLGLSYQLEFLKESKELNELSINEALKYDNNEYQIYLRHLDNNTIFKYIVIATYKENYYIRKELLKNLKYENFSIHDIDYQIKEKTMYSCIQNMLPSSYIYNDKAYIEEDNNVICKYKLKVTDKVLNLSYSKLLLQQDETHYTRILDYIINYLYLNKWKVTNFMDLILFMVQNKNFNEIIPSRVIALLKLYQKVNFICDEIIMNHKFFHKIIVHY